MYPHDCTTDGHKWKFLGYDDGLACYRCIHCGRESC